VVLCDNRTEGDPKCRRRLVLRATKDNVSPTTDTAVVLPFFYLDVFSTEFTPVHAE
jgi:hypothetical protein